MRRKLYALAASAAAATLVLAGCSGADSGSSNQGADDQPKLSNVNPQERDKLEQGGTVRFAMDQMPEQWNYLEASGNSGDLANIYAFVMAKNFDYAEDGEPSPNENYIKDAKVVDGPPMVVTLTLNPEAKWNNGDPITWEDYAAPWKACSGESEGFNCGTSDGWREIASIEKGKDDFEVVVTFKQAYPDWSGVLSQPYNKHAMEDPDTFNEGQRGEPNTDWFTGPFKIDHIDDAQKTVTLVPNDNWWGDKPLVDEVSFRALSGDLVPQSFANNEIDVTNTLVSADAITRAQGRPDGELRDAGSPQWRHFTFNSKAKNLGDKKVRQAIFRGVDRKSIAESDLAGMPVDPNQLMRGNHFFAPGQAGYQDNSGPYSYDPEAAGKLLDEAGWKLEDGKKFRTKDGEELVVDYALLTGVVTSENEGKLLQSDMEAIGVKVNLVNFSSDDFSHILTDRNFGIIAFTWGGTPYPLGNIGQIYGCDSKNNYTGICNDKIQDLMAKADVELDPKKRTELGNEIDKVIWDEATVLPIYRRIEFIGTPKNLANWGAFGISSVRTENIGYMKK